MNRIFAIMLIACCVAGCASTDTRQGNSASVAAQRLLVTTAQSTGLAMPQLGDPGAFYIRRRGYGPTPAVNRTLDRIADDYDMHRVEGWYISSIGQYCEVYELQPGQSVEAMIERLSGDPRVELVQPMNLFETQGVVYDDPYAPMQPALASLAIESAHEMSTGRGVVVAVIDSGVDSHHREFRGRIAAQSNLVDRRGRVQAEVHGTAVAGVIASAANNGEGIVGIAPDAVIIPLRACWTVDAATGQAACSSFSLAQALESAIRIDADVINLSLAGPDDAVLNALLDVAAERGAIVVAALPAHTAEVSFPASHRAVIAVESSESPAEHPAANVLRAPGAEVMSTVPNDGYAFFSGNSMSAAYVAGVSALMRETRPDIRPEEVLELLAETGADGAVNACLAIAAAAAASRSC